MGISEELREMIIKTGVDSLLDLIVEKDGLSVAEASRVLQIPSSKIESWATVLSKEKLITMKYEAGGNVVMGLNAKNMKSQQDNINKISSKVSEDIDKVDNELNSYEQTINLNKENINSFEKILNKDISKIEDIEKDLASFSKNKKELEASILKIKEEEKILLKKEENLEKKEVEISSKEKVLKSTSKDIIDTITEKLKIIDESHDKIVALNNEKNRLKEDVEFIKKISKVIEKEKDTDKLHERIKTVEEKHKALKDNSFLLKIKFEKFQEIVKKIFQV